MNNKRELAKELNVDLAQIYAYAQYLGFSVYDLSNKNFSEEQIEKIRECHFNSDYQNHIEETLSNQRRKTKSNTQFGGRISSSRIPMDGYKPPSIIHEIKTHYGYVDRESIKLIAKLKWFYNARSEREEGYVTFQNEIDFHFLSGVVEGIDPFHLKEGDDVVVTIQLSNLSKRKIRVSKLKPLSKEDDKLFFIHQSFFYKEQGLVLEKALNILHSKSVSIRELENSPIKEVFNTLLVSEEKLSGIQAQVINAINTITQWLDPNNLKHVLFNNLQETSKYQFWKMLELDIPYSEIKENLFTAIENNIQELNVIKERLSKEELSHLLEKLLNNSVAEKSKIASSTIINIFKIAKEKDILLESRKLDDKVRFTLWQEELIDEIPVAYISGQLEPLYISYLKESERNNFFDLMSIEEGLKKLFVSLRTQSNLKQLLLYIKKENSGNNELDLYRKLLFIIKSKEKDEKVIEDIIDELNIYPFDAIYEQLLRNFSSPNYKNIEKEKNYSLDIQSIDSNFINEFFSHINYGTLKKFFDRSIYELENINSDESYRQILFFMSFLRKIEEQKKFGCKEIKDFYLEQAFKKSTAFYKLKLFVDDYTDKIDYDDAVLYTAFLSSAEQKIFFKKIIRGIELGQLELSIEDLKRMVTADYQINEESKKIDGQGRDFTISVILKLIEDLSKGEPTKSRSIFDLIARQVKRPEDLLQITGFFEKCNGRTIIEPKTTYDSDNEPITTWDKKKTEFIAHRYGDKTYGEFCDGRKAIVKGTGKASLCKKSGFEFWWCENSKCFEPCRKKHNADNWKNYTLMDILRILKVDFDERQYEIVLNVINRVNLFLEHLSCRKCKNILKPVGKSNYAFYGVTRFHCEQEDCEEKEIEIYLSHCLNPKCPEIIDSRDSVRCKPQGHDHSCGWYICNFCYGCCTTPKIAGRKNIMNYTGQEYKCHDHGHRELGVICCKDCGTQMREISVNPETYNKILNWFIDNRASNSQIVNSGQRKDGKWWFIWSQGRLTAEVYHEKLNSLKRSGFNIPDIEDKFKDRQMISEPFTHNGGEGIFICPDCDHTLELKISEEFSLARKIAVEKFHNIAIKSTTVHI